ncbi:ABC transporter permease subunit [Candidatus Gottesmanbacteria bacterium]|nr:ABC transporter permease subunit [Candidatus Gottesmanbacteria bacterium]
MRYTHNIKSLRKRKHTLKISLIFTFFLVIFIFVVGFTMLDAKQFFLGFLASFMRVSVAYVIALLLSITISLLVTSTPYVEEISLPLLDALQSFPAFSLLPLLIVWFGKTDIVIIIILVIEMVWPLLFTILSGQKQIRQDLIDASHAFGATKLKYVLYVLFPLLFPAIITGSIVAWGEAWETIIAAEIIVALPGVGTYLSENGTSTNSHILAIGIFLLLLILFILNKYIWLPLLTMSTKYQQE